MGPGIGTLCGGGGFNRQRQRGRASGRRGGVCINRVGRIYGIYGKGPEGHAEFGRSWHLSFKETVGSPCTRCQEAGSVPLPPPATASSGPHRKEADPRKCPLLVRRLPHTCPHTAPHEPWAPLQAFFCLKCFTSKARSPQKSSLPRQGIPGCDSGPSSLCHGPQASCPRWAQPG